METVLVISYSNDHITFDKTLDLLTEAGHQVIRLNVDKYLTEWTISSSCLDSENWDIRLNHLGKEYLAKDINAVWYRRLYYLAGDLLAEIDKEYRAMAYSEAKTTLLGFISSMGKDVFMFNHPQQVRLASIKEWQKRVATKIGFKIPKTCISNDPETVSAFIKSCNGNVVSKMQASASIKKDGDDFVVMTTKLSEEQINNIEEVRHTPMIFQEFIPKSIEYRFTVIGKKIFTIALDISKNEIYEVDWRRDGHNSTKDWAPAQLPEEIEEKILQYMDQFHLNYGAGDILYGPDGAYYFLEVNPGGEYAWADTQWDGAIAKEIALLLANEAERRSFLGAPSIF